MKRWLILTVLAATTFLGVTGATAAPQGNTQELCGVKPYTVQMNFMSMEGYLRWQHFQDQKTWVELKDAKIWAEQVRQVCAKP